MLEVGNEMLSIIVRNKIADDNNNKEKINELIGLSDKKDAQSEQWNITILYTKRLQTCY